MKDTALYEALLGLKTPWSVKAVEVSLEEQRVIVEVELKRGQVLADPTDSTKRAHINGWNERHWRHLDTCQFETIIKARVPQLKYSNGEVEELAVPWAGRYSRITTLMEAFVVKLLQVCPTTKGVCKITRLSWSTVNGIMVSAVNKGLLRRSEEPVPHLGIDEKSIERGHTYASILTDIDRSRVLDLVPERTIKATVSLLGTLSSSQCASVEAVAMDMWPAYISATSACLPQADIVHDRFHVSKYLGQPGMAYQRNVHAILELSLQRCCQTFL
jgi:transposase